MEQTRHTAVFLRACEGEGCAVSAARWFADREKPSQSMPGFFLTMFRLS